MKRTLLVAAALVAAGSLQLVEAQTYQESGGLVVIEVESTPTAGSWVSETSVGGYTGASFYRWNGPDLFGSPGSGVLSYSINITNAGTYNLRIRNHHNHPDSTLENDCWTKMDGGAWIKTYSSQANAWVWNTRHEQGSTHSNPTYSLSAGTHTFQISGRSKNFRIDRFHLYLGSVNNPTNENYPQSSTGGGVPPPPPPPPPPTGGDAVTGIALINADTNQSFAGFDPLNSGATLNLGTLSTRSWNLQAVTSPTTVGSVVFGYDGNPRTQIESSPPYAFAGDSSGNYNPWTPTVGSHSVTATPYSASGGTGTAGTSITITFTVLDDPATPSTNGGGGGSGGSGGSGGTGGGAPSNREGKEGTCGLLGGEVVLLWAGILLLNRRRGVDC